MPSRELKNVTHYGDLTLKRDFTRHDNWVLQNPIVYRVWGKQGKIQIQFTVPSSFETDMASVPAIFYPIFPRSGRRWGFASLGHDYCYLAELFDRKTCDEIFYLCMISDGVPKWKAKAMYWAVRLGGGFVWAKHDPAEVQKMRDLGGYSELE